MRHSSWVPGIGSWFSYDQINTLQVMLRAGRSAHTDTQEHSTWLWLQVRSNYLIQFPIWSFGIAIHEYKCINHTQLNVKYRWNIVWIHVSPCTTEWTFRCNPGPPHYFLSFIIHEPGHAITTTQWLNSSALSENFSWLLFLIYHSLVVQWHYMLYNYQWFNLPMTLLFHSVCSIKSSAHDEARDCVMVQQSAHVPHTKTTWREWWKEFMFNQLSLKLLPLRYFYFRCKFSPSTEKPALLFHHCGGHNIKCLYISIRERSNRRETFHHSYEHLTLAPMKGFQD